MHARPLSLLSPAIMTEIKNGIATGLQDLSKGVVPVILVVGMVSSAAYVGGKVTDLRRDQEATAEKMEEVRKAVEGIPALMKDVALLSASAQTQSQVNVTLERDMKLLETRIKNLEIETEVRKRTER